MGIELARAYVTVRGDSTGLSSDFAAIQNKVTDYLRGIQVAAAAVTGAFAAIAGGFLRSGLQQAASFEQTTIQMETMLGSAKETKKTLDDLTEFAVRTPFTMPGILQVATQMIQFGERGDKLMETMNILADASGGTADKFLILGLVLNQIRGVGHLLTQDFRQLATRGIVSLQDLANYYGVTNAAAQRMLSEGKISFEDFRNVLKGLTEEGGRFFQMSEKQSKSLAGLQSTLSDAIGITSRFLAMGIVPWAKKVTEGFIAITNEVADFVQKGGEAVSLAFGGATAFAALAAALLGAGLAARFFGISLTGAIIGTGLGVAIIALGAGLGYLISQLKDNIVISSALSQAWSNVKEEGSKAFVSLFNAIAPVKGQITSLLDLITQLGETLATTLETMSADWSLTWEYMITTATQKLFAFAAKSFEILEKSAKGINKFLEMISFGAISGFKLSPEATNFMEGMRIAAAALKEQSDSLHDQMIAARNRQRAEEFTFGASPVDSIVKALSGEKSADKISQAIMTAERHSFSEFGRSLQDQLLKPDKDLNKERNDLLKESVKVQKDIQDAILKNPPKAVLE